MSGKGFVFLLGAALLAGCAGGDAAEGFGRPEAGEVWGMPGGLLLTAGLTAALTATGYGVGRGLLVAKKRRRALFEGSFPVREIRMLLTRLNGSLDAIVRSDDGTETAKRNLQVIAENMQRLSELCRRLPDGREELPGPVEDGREARREEGSVPAPSPAMDPVFIDKLNVYIEAHLTNRELSVELIAGEMNMSCSSLYRKVKRMSGCSPVDFIRMARLEKAVRLLRSGEKRISEIAYLTGFSSPAYFSATFREAYGKSPSEYRKEIR